MAHSGTRYHPFGHHALASGQPVRYGGHHGLQGSRFTDSFPRVYRVHQYRQSDPSWLPDQSLTPTMSKVSNLLDTGKGPFVSTHNTSSSIKESLGYNWGPHQSPDSPKGGQKVINYDVDEESNGNTAIKLLTTLTSPVSTSTVPPSSPIFPAHSVHQNHGQYSVDSSILYDSSSLFVTTNWSSNQSGIWDTTAQPEPEVYNVPRLSAEIQVALYSIIFSTALVGNLLIIITLIQNKRMRTVTNVFLLNLAVSDLLLALVCMPFTLVPVLLMDFIFGAFMCVFIRYLQAVSVGVSCFTLVALSLERYFAICRPLHSRSWQTLSHAYRCIGITWLLAMVLMTPVAVFQEHRALDSSGFPPGLSQLSSNSTEGQGQGEDEGHIVEEGEGQGTTEVNLRASESGGHVRHICREIWPDARAEQAYTLLLDLMLLVLPVVIMSLAYSKVVHVLMYDVRSSLDMAAVGNGQGGKFLPNQRMIELRLLDKGSCRSVSSYTSTDTSFSRSGTLTPPGAVSRSGTVTTPPGGKKSFRHNHRIRHSNPRKIRQNKLRVIRMLFVVVLEFFVCWTPVYVLLTWMLFHEESAYRVVTPMTKTLFHLLSYVSSCCNPITYCFMNKKFREAFLRVFQCRAPPQTIRERRMYQLQQQQRHQSNQQWQQQQQYQQPQAQQYQNHRGSDPTSNTVQFQQPQQQKRRSTAVSRLSESIKFNPTSSLSSCDTQTTPPMSRRAEEMTTMVTKTRRAPAMERCLLDSSRDTLDTDTPGSGSD